MGNELCVQVLKFGWFYSLHHTLLGFHPLWASEHLILFFFNFFIGV